MGHAQRKIHDLHAVRPSPITKETLHHIAVLYQIEAEIWGKPPDERRRVRQARAVPLLAALRQRYESVLPTLSAKSDTTKAIQYSLNRWPALAYYCEDGQVEIDNLMAEGALRGVAIGRRNYLLAGADSGGEHAAAMYSLIGTARLNSLNSQAYLAYVLERIADRPGRSYRRVTSVERGAAPARHRQDRTHSLTRARRPVDSRLYGTNRAITGERPQ